MAIDELNQQMSEKEMENAISRVMSRIDAVNTLYIQKIAAQVKKIGELSQSSINRLVIMSEMNADI